MSYDQNLIDFCTYVQPIVNSCAGFIKTDGYMVHVPGLILYMSADEMCCGKIDIPVIFDIYMTSNINTFLALKTPEQQSAMWENIYFVGHNIKRDHLMYYYSIFNNLDTNNRKIYHEPDCYNIPGFDNIVSKTDIGCINVSDGSTNYRVPASKSITSLSKGDLASLTIYDSIGAPNVKTIRYTMYKKKFKLTIDIYSNILVV